MDINTLQRFEAKPMSFFGGKMTPIHPFQEVYGYFAEVAFELHKQALGEE
jgi:hypothetical protein